MYFCNDVDLMGWEPGVFLEGGFGHQAVLREGAGTLTGTGLVMGAARLVVGSMGRETCSWTAFQWPASLRKQAVTRT